MASLFVKIVPKETGIPIYLTLLRPIDEKYSYHEWKIHEMIPEEIMRANKLSKVQ